MPVSLCGTHTTLAALLLRMFSSSCTVTSWSSLLNAALLLLLVIALSYIMAFSYVKQHNTVIKITCALVYIFPLALFLFALTIRAVHFLNIVAIDYFSFVFILWSLSGSVVFLVFFVEASSPLHKEVLQEWRNKSIIVVAIAAVFCFLLLSEGTLYCFFALVTLWDVLAVYWRWGPIRLMLEHRQRHKERTLAEQPQLLHEVSRIRQVARRRQRELLSGRRPEAVQAAVGTKDMLAMELELPPGLSYRYRSCPPGEGEGEGEEVVECDLGLLDVVLLGVVVGLAAKRPGMSAALGCFVASLLGASAATLHSAVREGGREVPALPAALGTCLVVYSLCCLLVPLQSFIDTTVGHGIYF
jgi:hypothetical protein